MKTFVQPLLVLSLLVAGAAFAIEVKTDYSHSADFGRYHTYSWIKIKADPLWEDRIMRAVDSELASKGWTKVDAGGDAGVAAFSSTKELPTLTTFYDSFGGGWYWQGFGDGIATTTVQDTPVGTLVIDLFDGRTQKLIWRGVASDALSGKPEKDEKKLDKAVADMFKHFPPPARG
jgi:hypothetical protein